jgi:transposase
MRVVHGRCCGLDVHKRTVVACVLTPDGQQTRTFGTMTRDLIALSEWLQSLDVSQVAMESTGVVRREVAIN